MLKFSIRRLRAFLERVENGFEAVLFLLSSLAVLLVVSNEVVPSNAVLPWLKVGWSEVQVTLRFLIWLVFVIYVGSYTFTSRGPWQFLKKHWVELMVCLTWLPYYDGSLLKHQSLFSLDMVTLIGSMAHAWRVVRWTVQRFNAHPMIVVGAAAFVMVTSASALLIQVEPQTFPDFWTAAWYCLVTVFTVGYGDFVPHSHAGKAVAVALMMSGISLAGVYLGLVSRMVQERIFRDKQKAIDNTVHCDLTENNRLLGELIQEVRRSNELNARILTQLEGMDDVPAKPRPQPKTE